MTHPNAPRSLQLKIGLFTLLGLGLIGALTVYVNDRPYWWRACEEVVIQVEDATGLKTKSPIRSLGLEIGYLKAVQLSETHVKLDICITAPVEVLPATRAYIRAEGFLGDKFVELKPVRYVGESKVEAESETPRAKGKSGAREPVNVPEGVSAAFLEWIVPSASAEEGAQPEPETELDPAPGASPVTSAVAPKGRGQRTRNIPVGQQSQDVQQLITEVDGLVVEMRQLTSNLKEAINPQDLKKVMNQLNKALENASKTLSPEGGLNTTAQRTLAKLEEAIEHLRDQMARINRGEGSVGKLLNDPSYAEEIRQAIRSVNSLLGRVSGIRFMVNVGAEQMPVLDGARGFFQLGIWPSKDRYYLLGITNDPRGQRTIQRTTTEAGGTTTVVRTTQVAETGLNLTGMLGKVLWDRLDLSLGILHGDGAASVGLLFGKAGFEERIQVRADVYARGRDYGVDTRWSALVQPFSPEGLLKALYLKGGLEGFRKVDVDGVRSASGHVSYFVGAGLRFDDEDIKLLFAIR